MCRAKNVGAHSVDDIASGVITVDLFDATSSIDDMLGNDSNSIRLNRRFNIVFLSTHSFSA